MSRLRKAKTVESDAGYFIVDAIYNVEPMELFEKTV